MTPDEDRLLFLARICEDEARILGAASIDNLNEAAGALREYANLLESREVPYDRHVLVETLVYHQRRDIQCCGCGWWVLGESHAEHIADIYEESVQARNS